jgi:hypothetical protein
MKTIQIRASYLALVAITAFIATGAGADSSIGSWTGQLPNSFFSTGRSTVGVQVISNGSDVDGSARGTFAAYTAGQSSGNANPAITGTIDCLTVEGNRSVDFGTIYLRPDAVPAENNLGVQDGDRFVSDGLDNGRNPDQLREADLDLLVRLGAISSSTEAFILASGCDAATADFLFGALAQPYTTAVQGNFKNKDQD